MIHRIQLILVVSGAALGFSRMQSCIAFAHVWDWNRCELGSGHANHALSQAPAGNHPITRKRLVYNGSSCILKEMTTWTTTGGPRAATLARASDAIRGRPGLGALKRTQTATAPVLMPGAYVRAPSFG
eukprot:COSAG02_NODE_9286_length_2266_cov_2.302261_1_plen_127_part_10